eukprot:CAMPEP_0198275628 /NCGR_PEP_ID=MMETSP1447-20131203/64876_1 /TAXON_ID=420782 /ORGANISM="Chaetoceros dichaeta, Strain CCMP1751" /LENGTH=99 /DNA_ID=CAMNT_0043970513 /DNA_START=1320 /DNA_END=1616 /DNA_ORIENTATION=-
MSPMTFPTDIVPRTTNATARRNPYLNLAKRKQNKLYYHLLPDGVISAFAAKGTANGAPDTFNGDNAVTAGMAYCRSLEEEFLEDDVARVAWMVYENEIR